MVLTHCVTLPNLARVIGIVLPDSMDDDSENEDDNEEEQSLQQQEVTMVHPKKRQRHHHLQRDNIWSITNAASVKVGRQKKSAATVTATQSKTTSVVGKNTNKSHHKNNTTNDGTQLLALVLHHAGQNCQWFCHPQQPTQNNNYLSEHEMKYYLCHLIVVLGGPYTAGIMHHDVKPRNTLINRFLHNHNGNPPNRSSKVDTQQSKSQLLPPTTPTGPPPLMLVDLGLTDFYLPRKEYNVRVVLRHYKSPELLIGFEYYNYAIDMWSVGCILAGLLFQQEPFFCGKDNEDQLGKIVSVLGTRDFLPYCRKCNVKLSSKARAAIGKYCSRASSSSTSSSSSEDASSSASSPSLLNNDMGRRTPWMSFLSSSPTACSSCPIPSSEALDSLDKLLVYNHE